MKYSGRCHCGKIRFEVEGEITGGTACNGSMRSRKGAVLWFVPRSQFKRLTPETDAVAYTFNKPILKTPLLRHLRHSSVRRRDGLERQAHGGDQSPLPGKNRTR
jgi:hypothetical protein